MASPTLARRLGLTGNRGCKAPVRAATSANIVLSGEQTVGGVAVVSGDRVLVWNQTSSVNNGIYDVSTGTWTRSIDANGTQDWSTGTIGIITSGTYANLFWILTTTGSIVPDTSAMTFQVGVPTLAVLAVSSGSSVIGFIQAGIGAVLRTAQAKMRDFLSSPDFGSVGDWNGSAGTDDTPFLQAAIDAAYTARASFLPSGAGAVYTDDTPIVWIPAKRYKLGSALSVPSACRLVAIGTASFEPSGAFPAINALNAYQLYIEGINFIGGTNAVVIQNNNTESTLIDFVNVEFKNTTDWAVTATPITPGGGISLNHLSAIMTFTKCKFHNVARGVKTWCDYTRLVDCWATWGDDLCASNTAFFEVRNGPTPATGNLEGGTLYLDNFVGVPNMALGKTTVRWIDNYWRVVTHRSRFGQEASGGIPVVYNYAPYSNTSPYAGGEIILRDGELWAGPNRADGGVIIFKTEVPGLIIIDGNAGPINTPYVINGGIANMTTYMATATSPERSFRFHIGAMTPGDQPDPSPLGALVQAEILPYVTGERYQASSNMSAAANCQIAVAPNVAKSLKSPDWNTKKQCIRLSGIAGPSGANVIAAGAAVAALGNAAHYPDRNLLLPAIKSTGVATYIQVLTNGSILTGVILNGSTETLQFDGISYPVAG